MKVLEFQAVTRSFGRRPILRDINMELAEGDRAVLRGANGTGKTTLLRVAATVLRPTKGTVRVLGTQGAAARNHLAFVAQDAPIYRELTPADHVQFAARLHGKPAGRGDAMIALNAAGLAKHAHRNAATLSRGQRQRLALATALHVAPPLLLLDEPFTALDDEGIQWASDALAAFHGTVLASVHGEAPMPATRELVLEDGVLT